MQPPIAPPYEEALSLLENKKTDFRKANISVVIENEGESSVSQFKKQALLKQQQKSEPGISTVTETACSDNNEEEASIDALHRLYISEETKITENT